MARQLLPHDVVPSDRSRGCLWASRFRRAGDEVQKLGTINGAPVINRGVTLDGAADYITYALWGQFTNQDPISYHCIFYPTIVPANPMAETPLFDTTVSLDYVCRLLTTGAWQFRLGGTSIINVALATYQGLWNTNGRNLISLWSTSGATTIMFNGTAIASAVATAWTPTVPTALQIGTRGVGAAFFPGRIEMLKFYGTYLQTALDHQAIWAGGGA